MSETNDGTSRIRKVENSRLRQAVWKPYNDETAETMVRARSS
jgi:hypothetical protein